MTVDLDRCLRCGELLSIAETEPNAIERLLHSDEYGSDLHTGQRIHRVCLMRSVIGSVAHLERRCSCFVPGSVEEDPIGMSKLEAAEAALKLWREIEFRRRARLAQIEDFEEDRDLKSSTEKS